MFLMKLKLAKRNNHFLKLLMTHSRRWLSGRSCANVSAPARALAWLRAHENPTGGIYVHSGHQDSYPEVTGYIIPTLLQYGEHELATRVARWLICIQRGDGAYSDPDSGKACVFDTGQVLRGLLAVADLVPGALDAARRAADYLLSQTVNGGTGGFVPRYSGVIPESVHLYILPALVQAGEILNRRQYLEVVDRCLEYYCTDKNLLQLATLTHFLGYELEALIELGRGNLAIPILDELRQRQSLDGSVPAKEGAKWVCAPGLAQLAVCWYKVEQWEPADKAMAWLEEHQQASGGFLGSYGPGASYFQNVELSWAVKFYLDAHRLRVTSFFERNANIFPNSISINDGRIRSILSVVQSKDRILEVGCGKGRFLKLINEIYPNIECTGIDISSELLSHVPPNIRTLKGSLESIPCPDDHYDVVFSVEALEHSPNPQAAVKEMVRVTRPGGWVMIIDKQHSHWGRLGCLPWEKWPELNELQGWLNRWCDQVSAKPVGYDGKTPDGLMVVWSGKKRCRLSGYDWNKVMISQTSQQENVERVRHHRLSEWAQVILLEIYPGWSVLEIGSGTGEISLHLAWSGRRVTTLDLSHESLKFIRRCAAELGVEVKTVQANATEPLPFPDDFFDCVWSSGLLEHFTTDERRVILGEQRRVARRKVISIVPNGACLAYRVGKMYQEARGRWPYGMEIPILSLRDDFDKVGLHAISEYSVGARQALSFLSTDHPLRKTLGDLIDQLSPEELNDYHQGYLLVTIGLKRQS